MRHIKVPLCVLRDPVICSGGMRFMGFLCTLIALIAEKGLKGSVELTWTQARLAFGMNRKALMDCFMHLRGCLPEHPEPGRNMGLRFSIFMGSESVSVRCLDWLELLSDRSRRTLKRKEEEEEMASGQRYEQPRPELEPALQRILDRLGVKLHMTGAIEYDQRGLTMLTPYIILPDLLDPIERDTALSWLHYRKRFPNGMGYPTSKRFVRPFLDAGMDLIEICQQIQQYQGMNDTPIWKVLQPLREIAESRIRNGGGDPKKDPRFQNLADILRETDDE